MVIKSRREREKEQRKKEILDSAEKLFFKKGYDDVSMNDIAKDVELNKATLYLYFDNKEDLFFASVFRGAKIMVSMIEEEVAKEETGIKKIEAFRMAYTHFAYKYPDYYWGYNYFQSGRFDIETIINSEYANEIIAQAGFYNIIHNIAPVSNFNILNPVSEYAINIIGIRRKIFDIVCDSIKLGMDEGIIRQDINTYETAVMLIMMAESAQNAQPDFIKILESFGINKEKFKDDFGEFVKYMLLNK